VDNVQHWNRHGHFFAAAAEAMLRILVERARHKKTQKAGGSRQRVELADVAAETDSVPDILAIDEALALLELRDKRKADVVKLRFFAGLTNQQAAQALGIPIQFGKRSPLAGF
jgi:RNA polymerase sigma factor (TIGR02999 family)